jgi:hypothetical protein
MSYILIGVLVLLIHMFMGYCTLYPIDGINEIPAAHKIKWLGIYSLALGSAVDIDLISIKPP